MMTDTIVFDGYIYNRLTLRSCIDCAHWDHNHVIDGFATCDRLVFAGLKWRLMPREMGKDIASIVRTPHDFECKYFEARK
jgi:hypothetical protein